MENKNFDGVIGTMIGGLASQLEQENGRVDANRKASVATDFAIISLLIDAGIITIPQLSERLALTQKILGNNYQDEVVTGRLNLLIQALSDSAASGSSQNQPQKALWNPAVIEGGRPSDQSE